MELILSFCGVNKVNDYGLNRKHYFIMASTKLKGKPVETAGALPQVGMAAPDFSLTGTDLLERSLSEYKGRRVLLNVFPSLDTDVCAATVRRFNQEAANMGNASVLCISKDLPFAHQRFCTTEGILNVVNLSALRDDKFGMDYGLRMTTGPLAGLLARAVIVLDEDGIVKYHQLVDEVSEEPDYEAALQAMNRD